MHPSLSQERSIYLKRREKGGKECSTGNSSIQKKVFFLPACTWSEAGRRILGPYADFVVRIDAPPYASAPDQRGKESFLLTQPALSSRSPPPASIALGAQKGGEKKWVGNRHWSFHSRAEGRTELDLVLSVNSAHLSWTIVILCLVESSAGRKQIMRLQVRKIHL